MKRTNLGKEFTARWKRINAFQLEEQRRLTPEQRVRHFFALMALAKKMNWQSSTPEEIDEVRRRWKKIKGYGGSPKVVENLESKPKKKKSRRPQ